MSGARRRTAGGRGRPSRQVDLITGLRAYLDRAYADPVLPLGASEVAERIGVARSTFYEHRESAAVAPLIAELDELRQRRAAMFREAEAVAKQAAEQEPAANGRRDDSIRATPKVGGSTSERGTELPQHQVAEQYGIVPNELRIVSHPRWAIRRDTPDGHVVHLGMIPADSPAADS